MDKIHEILQLKYPHAIISPLTGGGTNSLFLIKEFDNRSVVKVAMISNSNARKEEACLNLLRESNLVPTLYSSFLIDGRIALQMNYIDGESLLAAILSSYRAKQYTDIYSVFSSLGELLGQIHKGPIAKVNTLPEIKIDKPTFKPFIEEHLYEHSLEMISCLSQVKGNDTALLHGDYGYHNVLTNGTRSRVIIDWEMAGYGDPCIDIGNVLFWTHLHFPEIASNCVEAFIMAYKTERNIQYSSEIINAIVVFQIYRILDLVKNDFPEHVKKEWNRRLGWALHHKFI